MPIDALVTMLIAIVLLWGGLVASIGYAVKVSRDAKKAPPAPPAGPPEE